jgi:hypothetical protein
MVILNDSWLSSNALNSGSRLDIDGNGELLNTWKGKKLNHTSK